MDKQRILTNEHTSPPSYYHAQGGYPTNPAPAGYEYNPGQEKVSLDYSGHPQPGGQPPPPQGVFCAQPGGYVQQPAIVFVQPTALTNPPPDHLGYSIFVTLCCCWLIGLFAIIRSTECRTAVSIGDRTTAELKSRQAKKLANIALALGIVSIVISVILVGVYIGVTLSAAHI